MDITSTFRGICKAQKSLSKLSNGSTGKKPVPFARPSASDFQKNAQSLAASISKVRDIVLGYRNDYLNAGSSLSDLKRDELDNDAYEQLARCSSMLKQLQENVHHVKQQARVHRTEVLHLLNLYLAAVSKMLTEQRGQRIKRALERKKMSKLETAVSNINRPLALRDFVQKPAPSIDVNDQRPLSKLAQTNQRKNSVSSLTFALDEEEAARKADSPSKNVFSSEELQMFEHENAELFDELSGMEDDVRLIEAQVVEISQMNRIITENVVMQERQIDSVLDSAIESTENIQLGNIDIREAIQKIASFRAWVLFVVLVLSFTLLFLDWYND